jgi:hypothetical protein
MAGFEAILYGRFWVITEELIGSVRTTKGLFVKAKLDKRSYETGIKVRDVEMDNLNIAYETFHGDWNYTIRPNEIQSDDQVVSDRGLTHPPADGRPSRFLLNLDE